MVLYFLRHALAGTRSEWHEDDSLRPLTTKGRKKMVQEAKVLVDLVPNLDRIITSPLTRSLQTAEIAAEALGMGEALSSDDRLRPGFDLEKLGGILQENAEAEALMLVGHEPDFSETVAALVGGGRLVFKKGGLARVDLTRLDPPEGELVWLIPPKALL